MFGFPCLFSGSHGRAPRGSQPSCKLDVLLLDGDALGVDGAEVCVVEEVDQERFCGFLQREYGLRLPSVGAVVAGDGLGDFTDLERTWVSYVVCGIRRTRHTAMVLCFTTHVPALVAAPTVVDEFKCALTSLWNGSFNKSRSVVFWYLRISLSATVPGL